MLSRPPAWETKVLRSGLLRTYSTTFVFTLTNPMTILSFAANVADPGIPIVQNGYLSSVLLVSGIFSGSALWWLLLSASISLLRPHFTPRTFNWLNRLSGGVLRGLGLRGLGLLALSSFC